MRNISFSLTENQFLDGSKTVTRRLGWKFLKPGDRLRAIRKAMGLKKGEKVHVLGEIEVVSVSREKLYRIVEDAIVDEFETSREGFPKMTPDEFVCMFCFEMNCTPETFVTRIEFRRFG